MKDIKIRIQINKETEQIASTIEKNFPSTIENNLMLIGILENLKQQQLNELLEMKKKINL